jgi:hypothetical protein
MRLSHSINNTKAGVGHQSVLFMPVKVRANKTLDHPHTNMPDLAMKNCNNLPKRSNLTYYGFV